MKFATIFASALANATAAANAPQKSVRCLCPSEAEQTVQRLIGILTHKGSDLGDDNSTAEALLADSFYEVSDSILALQKLPVSLSYHFHPSLHH